MYGYRASDAGFRRLTGRCPFELKYCFFYRFFFSFYRTTRSELIYADNVDIGTEGMA
jgi:hypothetical protein